MWYVNQIYDFIVPILFLSIFFQATRRHHGDMCDAKEAMWFPQFYKHLSSHRYQSYLHQTVAEYLKVTYNLDDNGEPPRR